MYDDTTAIIMVDCKLKDSFLLIIDELKNWIHVHTIAVQEFRNLEVWFYLGFTCFRTIL